MGSRLQISNKREVALQSSANSPDVRIILIIIYSFCICSSCKNIPEFGLLRKLPYWKFESVVVKEIRLKTYVVKDSIFGSSSSLFKNDIKFNPPPKYEFWPSDDSICGFKLSIVKNDEYDFFDSSGCKKNESILIYGSLRILAQEEHLKMIKKISDITEMGYSVFQIYRLKNKKGEFLWNEPNYSIENFCFSNDGRILSRSSKFWQIHYPVRGKGK